jgi:hypothetical protein
MALPDREEQPRFRFPGIYQDVDSVCPNGPQAHVCRERLAITFTAAQRVKVDAHELRIIGSKSKLLRTFVAASSAKMAGFDVPSSLPKWRAAIDEDEQYCFGVAR